MTKSETQTSWIGKLLSHFFVGVYCPETGRQFHYSEDDMSCSECGSDIVMQVTLGGASYGHK